MGFLMTGFGIGGSFVFVFSWVIESLGWRNACIVAGIIIWVISLPLSLFVRHKPEDMGLRPDGFSDSDNFAPSTSLYNRDDEEEVTYDEEPSFTAREALSTRAFWMLAPVYACWSMVPPTMTAHMIPYLQQEVGASPAVAALSLSAFAFISLFGRIPVGWLGDYVNLKYLLALLFVMMGVGLLMFSFIHNTRWIPVALVILGPAYGGSLPLRPAIQGHFFGRKSFGTIGGFLQFVDLPATVAAPFLVGWIADTTSYRLEFQIVAVLVIIGSICVLLANRPVYAQSKKVYTCAKDARKSV
ncbi:MAG: MFS transporter [SAR202 cluster bacterium]|nr:MFS transporter [SAR202 cluster bacterium]|tara:strand:+ start:10782 stop:11678 length:897 start_codon:yes stop_codon:yes gene_type:complete